MRRIILALGFLSSIALAQNPGEPIGRDRAILVPNDWVPRLPRDMIEKEAGGRSYVVRRIHIGDRDLYEGDFGSGRVRVSEDGAVIGRD
jgi:hypothetical protein